MIWFGRNRRLDAIPLSRVRMLICGVYYCWAPRTEVMSISCTVCQIVLKASSFTSMHSSSYCISLYGGSLSVRFLVSLRCLDSWTEDHLVGSTLAETLKLTPVTNALEDRY